MKTIKGVGRFYQYFRLTGIFTGRGCCRCKASAHEAVVYHREWEVTKQM